MVPRQRGVVGRTRLTPRASRRAGASLGRADRLAEAQRAARRYVAAHWPELAAADPIASGCPAQAPGAELLARLGLGGDDLPSAPERNLTFTFIAEPAAADKTPLVANITVDARLRIIKASVSRSR